MQEFTFTGIRLIIFDFHILIDLQPEDLELIKRLRRKCPLCIASTTHEDTIVRKILKKFNIEEYFDKIVSNIDVQNGKPAPDVFLKVAKLMDTNPINCLVIEDSLAGLQAAKAARMNCIICLDNFARTPFSEFEKADLIVKNLNEIII